MGNVYIPPSDSEMLHKLDLELEKHNDINGRHPIWDKNCKAPNKNGKILEDMSQLFKFKMAKTQHTCIKEDREL